MDYNLELNTRHELAEYKLFSAYLRKVDGQNRKETWNEAVDRVFDQTYYAKYKHITDKNKDLCELIEFARDAYRDKLVLASQRILQFGGPQILKHEMKVYNCTTSYCDRPRFFQECMYILLAGSGVGFSVQYKHHDKLPLLIKRSKATKTFQIPDSIEGWTDSIGVIISSFLSKEHATFPEYSGKIVHMDYSLIRLEGALISGGFKAPGPNGLKASLEKIEELLNRVVNQQAGKLETIDSYDMVMYLADAVLSGGVRRSATICLFSVDDELMTKAKTGNWFTNNPQRARKIIAFSLNNYFNCWNILRVN